jgi:HPt (histidine-containing phosphotransfer) domain-containing protein
VSQGKIRVQVDSQLQEVLPVFLKNREKDIRSLELSISKLDFEAIEVIGHQLKGAAGGYGFFDLGKIGATLEKAASKRDIFEVQRSLEAYKNFMKEVEITFV